MSKPRLTHAQHRRIKKKHQYDHSLSELERDDTTLDGLVITRHRRHALVEDNHGALSLCAIRPSIDSLVAGDRVIWQAEGDQQGMILHRCPRQSMLGRPDARRQLKPIAANITQIMVVVAPMPAISWPLLDSYLVMAETLHIHPTIILNKTDLDCVTIQQTLLQDYEPLGYSILLTHRHEENYNRLEKALHDQTSVFVGQSGVGKSSLVTRVLPHIEPIQTRMVSPQSQLGRHTTSNSYFYHLPTGGGIIDSPGVREFGLWHMPTSQIATGYREFKPYLPQCKFRNCNHRDAPGCAIIHAVKNKLISCKRYENYVKISTQFEKQAEQYS